MDTQNQSNEQRPYLKKGDCCYSNCDDHRIWSTNGMCFEHNKLIADYRAWLGLDEQNGLTAERVADAEFDNHRALLWFLSRPAD